MPSAAKTLAVLLLVISGLSPRPGGAAPQDAASPDNALARDIYRQLVQIDTSDSSGDTTKAAEVMAERLRVAGFPAGQIDVLAPFPRKGNLVARFPGSGKRRPLLLLAHLDVVEARSEDWDGANPFALVERDGYFYGRGAVDDKAMAAIWVATLIRLRSEGFQPDRDLILALTADEEGGAHNGVRWLVENRREAIAAALCLNEGGGSRIRNGKPLFHALQASEKTYQNFVLEVKSPGGHSARPTPDNAIYRLAEGLTRLAKFEFPVRLNESTTAYFRKLAEISAGQTAADLRAVATGRAGKDALARIAASPEDNAMLRTTCVATRLEAGHADNALPQTARALVNCRILPGESPQTAQAEIARVLADSRIEISPAGTAPPPGAPSPLTAEIVAPIERIAAALWPGVPVIPLMSTGATDGMYLRPAGIPTYGVPGLFTDAASNGVHGAHERLGVKAFYEGREFLYRLVKALSS